MANKLTIEVLISDNGTAKLVQRNVEGVGKAAEGTTKKTREAKKAQDEYNYSLNQGVTGVSSAARSFSKLNQAIGNGPNGLVGAYATLAANAFAVSAAFNVLRDASQAQQVMKGLEVQGARLGYTLTNTAKSIQEISRGSLSMAESMQTAAQAAAAGMSPKTMEDLAQAATNASIALGRNMSDSMDRMVKGVTKLEPELLDELGVMVKITEASQKYADQNNKVASALTQSEKRQAFLNAVLEESRVKFGGLSEEVDPEPYQQLAATFQNLTKTLLDFVNNGLGVSSFVKMLADNTWLLVGVLIMFVSTISRQLIPGLYGMSNAALKARDAINKKIAAQKMSIMAARQEAEATRSAARSTVEQLAINNKNKQFVIDYATKVKEGTATEQERVRVLKQLGGQLGGNKAALNKLKDTEVEQIAVRKAVIVEIEKQIAAIKQLSIAEIQAATISEQANNRLLALNTKQQGLRRLGAAQSAQANAIDAASTFNVINAKESLGKAFDRTGKAIALYRSGVQKTGQAFVELGGYTGTAGKVMQAGVGISNAARVSFFALSTSVRVLGAALLNAIPIIGQIIFGIQLLWELGSKAWDWMFPPPEGQEALDRAKEAHEEILKSVEETSKQVRRTLNDPSLSASQHADALTSVSNKVKEIADSYDEVAQAEARLGTARARIEMNPIAGIEESAGRKLSKAAIEGNSGALESVSKLRTLGYEKLTEAIDEAITYNEAFWASTDAEKAQVAARLLPLLRAQFGRVGEVTKESSEAFKELDQAYKDFIQSATITTPFDGIVTAYQKVELSLARLRTEYDKGALTYREYSKAVVDSVKGTASQAYLSEELQKQIRSVQEYESYISRVKVSLAQNRTVTGEMISSDVQRLGIMRQIEQMEETAANSKEILLERTLADLTANIEKTYEYQRQSILAQGQAKILQAQLQTQQEIYATGGAGMKAKLEKEQQIRALEAQSLKAQADMISMKIRQNEIALETAKSEYESKLNELKVLKEITILRAEERALAAGWTAQQISNITAIPAVNAGDRSGRGRVTEEMVNSLTSLRDLRLQSNTLETEINERLETQIALTNEVRAANNALLSLQQQIAAINEQNLTAQQKSARIAQAQANYELGRYQRTVDTNKLLLDEEESRIKLRDLINGTDGSISRKAASVNRAAAREQFDLLTNYYSTRVRLESELAVAIADQAAATPDAAAAAAQRVADVRDELSTLYNQTKARARNIDLQRQLNVLEAAGFDAKEGGLKAQQDSLKYLEKELEVNRSLAETQLRLTSLRNRLNRARSGLSETENTQRAEEITVATRKLNLAKQEYELKASLINLEFSLLDAQRVMLKEQLTQQKAALLSTGAYTESSASIQQLTQAINNLDNIAGTTQSMKDAALQGLRAAFDEADLELQVTLAEGGLLDPRKYLENNPVMQMVSTIDGIQKEIEARNKAAEEQRNGIVIRGVAIAANAENAAALAVSENGTLVLESQATMIDRLTDIKTATETMASTASNRVTASTSLTGAEQLQTVLGRNLGLETRTAPEITITPQASGAINAAIVDGFRILTRSPGNLLAWPVENFRMGQGYGAPRDNGERAHAGRDLISDFRAEVFSPISGEVTNLVRTNNTNAGLMVTVTDRLTGLQTKLMHFDSILPNLRIGSRVNAGDTLGYAGVSGNANARPGNAVVHFETYLNGRRFDALDNTIPVNLMPYTDGRVQPGSNEGDITVIGQRVRGSNTTPNIGTPGIGDGLPGNNRAGETPADNAANGTTRLATAMQTAQTAFGAFNAISAVTMSQLSAMGAEGQLAAQFIGGLQTMSAGIQQFAKSAEDGVTTTADKLMLLSSILSGIQQMLNASANKRIANIEKEIAAEQKRDGKSQQSLAKLDAMEKKKDAIAKKQFNTNKKLMLAQAVMATAAGIAGALATQPTWLGIALAGIVGAMGLAQIAIISGMQYESSYSPKSATTPSSLTIGKRGDTVDLAKGPNYNAGGEVGYLRGSKGTGSNASNFNTIGSAYGGELMRGYGNRGFVVGEKGPEVITPETPITVTPANENNGNAPVNATINIQALDASDVKKVLVDNRGNIIQMLREAANNSGQRFLEDVNVNVYTRPNIGKL